MVTRAVLSPITSSFHPQRCISPWTSSAQTDNDLLVRLPATISPCPHTTQLDPSETHPRHALPSTEQGLLCTHGRKSKLLSFAIKFLNFPGPNPPCLLLPFQKPNAQHAGSSMWPSLPHLCPLLRLFSLPGVPHTMPYYYLLHGAAITEWDAAPKLERHMLYNVRALILAWFIPHVSRKHSCHSHHSHSPASPSLQGYDRCPCPSSVLSKYPRLTAIIALILLCYKY